MEGAGTLNFPENPRHQRMVVFVKNEEDAPTFSADADLPSLPVPSLEGTLERYMESVSPHMNDETLARVRNLAATFRNGEGRLLQEMLRQRAANSRNWLREWWEEVAYLRNRAPLVPYTSCTGMMPVPESIWPIAADKGLRYLSITLYFTLQFWQLLREQRLRVDQGRDGRRFSMEQFQRMFNTTRIPGPECDHLLCLWHPESEDGEKGGPPPRHVVVFCRGHIFYLLPFDSQGRPFSAAEWELRLGQVWKQCQEGPRGPGLGVLTSAKRDAWSQHRSWLRNISSTNATNLDLVENAMFAVVLDESSPRTESQAMSQMLGGDLRDRWQDKSISLVGFRNGRVGVLTEHSPFDAMVLIAFSYFAFLGALELRTDFQPLSADNARHLPEPRLLQFQLDSILSSAIQATYVQARRLCDNLVCQRRFFLHYGKGFLRRSRLHPDAFMQAALQLAYLRLHRQPGAAYETATTRQFYCGRTETLRSCTPEVIEWARAMDNPAVDKLKRRQLLVRALERHQELMEEAKQGLGCDRHLLGLLILASKDGQQSVPDLFRDPSWTLSGGGGNFVLSTSLLGYTPMGGGCAPMCRHGYGCFYTVEENRISVFISAWRDSAVTSVQQLHRNVERALLAMQRLVVSTASPL